jgi:hypothetical protein
MFLRLPATKAAILYFDTLMREGKGAMRRCDGEMRGGDAMYQAMLVIYLTTILAIVLTIIPAVILAVILTIILTISVQQ